MRFILLSFMLCPLDGGEGGKRKKPRDQHRRRNFGGSSGFAQIGPQSFGAVCVASLLRVDAIRRAVRVSLKIEAVILLRCSGRSLHLHKKSAFWMARVENLVIKEAIRA